MKTRIFAIILSLCLCLLPLVSCTADDGTSDTTAPEGNANTPTEKAMTKADYAAAFNSVSEKCLELTSPGANAKLSVYTPLAATDYVEANRLDIVRASVWYVGFLENVCKNETYELTDDYSECYAEFMGDYFNIRFKMSYAADTGRILSTCYALDLESNTVILLEFDINYDTADKKLNDFYLNAYLGSTDLYKFSYDGEKLYQLDAAAPAYAEFSDYIRSFVTTHNSMTWGENLVDYSKEYSDACPYEMAG
ncbi:MAG: hypothetical protein IJX46_10095 [Clostridia bacterium]|nr:hypothetical protein [Clostridia bacterium]